MNEIQSVTTTRNMHSSTCHEITQVSDPKFPVYFLSYFQTDLVSCRLEWTPEPYTHPTGLPIWIIPRKDVKGTRCAALGPPPHPLSRQPPERSFCLGLSLPCPPRLPILTSDSAMLCFLPQLIHIAVENRCAFYRSLLETAAPIICLKP